MEAASSPSKLRAEVEAARSDRESARAANKLRAQVVAARELSSPPPPEAVGLLDLPTECVMSVVQRLPLGSVLGFSLCCKLGQSCAESDEVWRPLFEARDWARPVRGSVEPGGWRSEFAWQIRSESPLIIQMSALRSLVGFASGHGLPHRQPRPLCGSSGAPVRRRGRLVLDSIAQHVDELLAAVGVGPGRPVVADVCFIAGIGDTAEELVEVVAYLFARGAARVRLLDYAVAALHYSEGYDDGIVLSVEPDGVCAACVHERKRLPLPRRAHRSPVGVADVFSALVTTAFAARSASASSSATATASAATPMDVVDVAYLLEKHCYVRAVSVRRLPVSEDERSMSACRIEATSGCRWPMGIERFSPQPLHAGYMTITKLLQDCYTPRAAGGRWASSASRQPLHDGYMTVIWPLHDRCITFTRHGAAGGRWASSASCFLSGSSTAAASRGLS